MKKFALFLLATALACCSALALAATPEKVTYVFTDPAGSPLVLTDAAGAVVSQYRYEPFGEQTVLNAGRTTDTAIGFAGKRLDPTSDLQYSLARYYDRRNGRFVSLDPLGPREGDPHSFNRYAYGNNNPYKFVDPDGRNAVYAFRAGWMIGVSATTVFEMVAGVSLGVAIYNVTHDDPDSDLSVVNSSSGAAGSSPPPDDDKEKGLSKEDRKSIRSLEKQIDRHQQKITDFKNNPSVRPGMEGQSKEVVEAQQAARIRHLETEIRTFQNNIDKIRGG